MNSKNTFCYCVLVGCLFFVISVPFALAQTWTSSGPINREFHSAVLDPASDRMIIFGGLPAGFNTNSQQNLNDVWRLNAAGGPNLNWIHVKPAGPPPAPRLFHSAVYDSGSNRMIVFGGGLGRTSPCENDVWVLTNANGIGGTPAWIQMAPAGPAPAPRAQHGAVYDPNTNTMIVYGGQDCFSTVFGDVWVLSNANGLNGTPAWMPLSPVGGGPGPREINGGTAYDPTNNRLIVFGGVDNGMELNDTWVLSNANGQGGTPTWSQLSPSGSLPPARGSNSTVYDATTNRLTIFGGGICCGTLFNDSWVLTNANGLGGTPTWSQIASSSADFPQARLGHTAVYRPSTNKMTIFGGQLTPCCTLGPLVNDVWVLDHANGQ